MLPKTRQSRTRGRIRRSHDALSTRASISCPNCSSAKLPHAACRKCGYVRPGLKITPGSRRDD